MIYFDHAATSNIHPEVLKTYKTLLDTHFANSESNYQLGSKVSKNLEKCRDFLSETLGCKKQDLIFTSGASEANSLAIKGIALANRDKGKHLITTQIEHASVLNSFEQLEKEFGFDVTYLPVNDKGVISVSDLKNSLRPDTILVSIMYVNNEVGSINPIEEIKTVVSNSKAYLHVDMVQALSKCPINLEGIDAASFSAHKIGGVKGSGLLYKKAHIACLPLINGGSQEYGLRGGTLDALSHTVFYKTLRLSLEQKDTVKEINHYLREEISQLPFSVIHSPIEASPYILSFSLTNLTSELMANALAEKEIYVSYRSTCHNKDAKGSHVLAAMGKSEKERASVLRLSFDHSNTLEEAKTFIKVLKGVIEQYG